ncbi:MAG TPA: hypothetical protein VGJ86_16395 [Acidimicrobiales bacterium]
MESVGQETEYTLLVRNDWAVSLTDWAVSLTLPVEVGFVSASDGGEEVEGAVIWLVTVPPASVTELHVTGL